MYSAATIASVFVQKAIKDGAPITQMKLQKMVFFAQGYHLVKYDTPLFEEVIQAWKFGPVIPKLYDIYKFYGSQPIADTSKILAKYNEVDYSLLSDKIKDAIDYTFKATGHLSGPQLSAWTHQVGSPWHTAYSENNWEAPIPNEEIKAYFDKFLNNED